ncbi:MAG: SDR family NAD(P)-dependent oxidoreductase [Actinomycetota bacterium]|nr:SDR family NAD(P)-dependent oxidoreductase [Actinomycetota bacterium]
MVGHSQGEVAAAVVCGALSLADGARVVALRSAAIARRLAGAGAMLSVALSEREAAERIEGREGVSIAAVNSPGSVVLSGLPGTVEAVRAELAEAGVRVRRIAVDYASHSEQVELLRDDLLTALAPITPQPSTIPFLSTLTGDWQDTTELTATYWFHNLRERVRFAPAVRALLDSDHRAFLEIGPHPVLVPAVQETAGEADIPIVATGTLRRNQDGVARVLTSLAEAYVHGVDVDWTGCFPGARRTALPTYPFRPDSYWLPPVPVAVPGAGAGPDLFALTAADLDVDPEALAAVLPALTAWQQRRDAESTVDGWRYRVDWVPVTLPAATPGGTWLLVAAGPRGAALADLLTDPLSGAGAELRVVAPGEVTEADCIISALALDDGPGPEPSVSAAVAGTVALIQTLGERGIAAPLWTITSGAVSTGPGDPVRDPAQALVAGVAWTAALEHPDRIGGTVDLPADPDRRAARRIAAALAGGAGEDQLAVRGHGLLARRIAPAPAPATATWQPTGTTLVTGGTGTLAPHVSRWLAGRGVTHLTLISRRGPAAPGAAELVAELAALGTEAEVVACDVTDATALTELRDRLCAAGRPVGTVVHAAATIELAAIAETGPAAMHRVLDAKVRGAQALDEVFTGGHAPQRFVLFSSVAGMWASGRHAAYVAGNAYLHALAEHRRARGLAATAVFWGIWADDRESGRVDPSQIRRSGLNFMAPDRALLGLARALDADDTAVAVADVDWETYHPVFTAARPSTLFDTVPAVRRLTAEPSRDAPPDGELAARLRGLPAAERERFLLDLVRAEAAAVLGHGSAAALPERRSFRDAGFDSVTAVDLRNRLARATGLTLPATTAFDHPSPLALARFLDGLLGGAGGPDGDRPAAAAPVTGEPIAIVAMGCRYPGGANSPEKLWELVAGGVDAISGFPADRGWPADALYDPDPDTTGRTYSVQGGFLHDVADFDAGFFGVSPREALVMDPQQRLLLEIAWETFERAGIDPHTVRGSRTGTFVGASYQDYGSAASAAVDSAEGHQVTGSLPSVLSGRIAYLFGLEGPALTVDTACSSSLVALHLAARSLAAGESDLALAGGVSIMATPAPFIGFSRQRALARDGRCKAYADGADGMTLAEGAGLILLERLSDAQRHGHPVLAVLRGSAVNSDGASNGLTAPNGPSQQRVITAALAAAGLTAAEVDVVEGHGTGTALGDPIEAQALLATYGRDRDLPLLLGSVKSNIGHTQMASGVASVIKLVEALRHGVLPRSLHITEPSTAVDWSSGAIELLTEQRAWPATGRPRRAGVSSFGLSGTNVHAVLEEASAPAATPETADGPVPVLVSARDEAALRQKAGELLAYATGRPGLAVPDLARALALHRSSLELRAGFLAENPGDLIAALTDLRDGRRVPQRAGRGRVAFLFAGQGSQRLGMGRELYDRFDVFADALDEVLAHFDPEVRDTMWGGDAASLNRTGTAQPALFAVEVALTRLLASFGVHPDQVAGHSIGELAAAHVAGVLSLADACTVVAARARLMQALPEGGVMAAVRASEDELTLGEGVSIAAINAPGSVVLSGDRAAVEAATGDRRTTWLAVSHAFHSHLMEPMLAEFGAAIDGITVHQPRLPVVSTVGRCDDFGTAAYWVRQVREPVRFADAVAALTAAGVTTLLEVGPDSSLTAHTGGVALLHRTRPETAALTAALIGLHERGAEIDWTGWFTGSGVPAGLPTYPFQRERYWPAAPALTGVSDADALRYHVTWQPLTTAAIAPEGRWLVLLDAGTAAPGWLPPGWVTARIDTLPELDGEVAGVISLLALDAGAEAPLRTADAVRALADAGIGAPLWSFTRGAVAAGPGEPAPDADQAAVWGLGRVIALERPAAWGGLIDLPPGDLDRHTARRALAALGGAEDQVAVRAAGLLGRRLTHAPRPATGDEYRPTGAVLVTGGTGALGAHVARWLADRGAEHLVLLSRRGPDADGAAELTADLTARGARVTVTAADAADRAALAAALTDEITAVFHVAGAVDDGVLDSLDAAKFGAVWDKVTAARHLDELTRDRDLVAFVLFTSTAGVIGAAGQGNYAAANAAVDAIAAGRRVAGLPATAVAWGPWAGGGMAAGTPAGSERMRRAGLTPMLPDRALTALGRAVGADHHVALFDADWTRFAAVLAGQRPAPLFAALPEAREVAVPTDRPALAGVRETLAAAAPERRAGLLLDLVRDVAARVLGHARAASVDVDRPFRDLGFDSLTTLELRNATAAATGLTLSASLVYDHPTPRDLAAFLGAELGADPGGAVAPPAEAPARRAGTDPVVVVGVGCRFPGDVGSPDDLWDLVADGRDAIGPAPADRGWDPAVPVRGGFLAGAADFDADFFGISPREALAMDPQQRLLLETAWEALERSGIDPSGLRGSDTGVFVGTNGQDYVSALRRAAAAAGSAAGAEDIAGHVATGTTASVMSGRIAYTLGLEGPAVTLDTACSASLVALHWASRSLRAGECSLALAGGVSVMSTLDSFAEFSLQGGLAPDGRCKAFGAGADGTSWSEGAGILVLERLSDARRHGHRVLAVVKGSAVNADGASNGLTAPNGLSQQRVIRAALADAGLGTGDVDAVEAHGTGTALGDPIEAEALLATYGRERATPLLLGSVKSNLGHTQGAAGVAGVIKMIEALRRARLPRTLHADEPSPHVDWTAGAVEILAAARDWPSTGRPRRAAVSAFGISGTNAHVILEQAPDPEPDPAPETVADQAPDADVVPWPVSARSEAALDAQAARLAALAVSAGSRTRVGRALTAGRALLPHRAVLLAGPGGVLTEVARGRTGQSGATAVLFTGQGAQRLGMGRALYERYDVFADALDAVLAHLDPDLRDVMWGDDPERLTGTAWAQPALFAIEVALFRLVESWGVRPSYLLGHSVGELAAAHVAGVLSLADAAALVTVRARLMAALPDGGVMAAVRAGEDELTLGDEVSVAAVNAPGSVVLSGTRDAVRGAADGRKTTWLTVSHAFHSHLMEPMLDDFAAAIDGLATAEARIPVVPAAGGDDFGSPAYWVRQVREPVRFADGVRTLYDAGVRTFLELGPDGVLTAMAATVLAEAGDVALVPALRADRDEETTLLTALGALHVRGTDVDWAAYFGAGATADLPTYPFQRRRFWPDVAPGRAAADPVDAEFWSTVEHTEAGDLAASLEVDRAAVAAVVPALAAWRHRLRRRAVADSWRYETTWIPAAATGDSGDRLVLVPAGAGLPTGDRIVAVADGPDLASRLAALDRPVSEVVSLLAAGPLDPARPDGHGWPAALLPVLAEAGIDAPLWCVTINAVVTGPGDLEPDPMQAAVWGQGRVCGLEDPRVWGGLIDTTGPAADLPLTVADLPLPAEDQVAWRDGRYLSRRLVRAAAAAADHAWIPTGTVLLAGPAAAVETPLGAWLAGTAVVVTTGGVTSRDELAEILDGITDLTAVVIVGAGRADAVPVAETLDDLLGDCPLDAFLLSGTIAGVWGATGRAVEAAEVAALEAVALRRHRRGRTATWIAWGAWSGAETDAPEQHLRLNGLPPIPADTATALLARIVADRTVATVVADIDWDRFAPSFTALRPTAFFDTVPEVRAALDAAAKDRARQAGEAGQLAVRLRDLPPGDRQPALLTVVRERVAAVLGHHDAAEIAADRAFKELGFDSLTAVDLRNQLATTTGLSLPVTLAFDHPTPVALAEHLLAELLPDNAEADERAAVLALLAAVPENRLRELGVLDPLRRLAGHTGASDDADDAGGADVDAMSLDDLINAAHAGGSATPQDGKGLDHDDRT